MRFKFGKYFDPQTRIQYCIIMDEQEPRGYAMRCYKAALGSRKATGVANISHKTVFLFPSLNNASMSCQYSYSILDISQIWWIQISSIYSA